MTPLRTVVKYNRVFPTQEIDTDPIVLKLVQNDSVQQEKEFFHLALVCFSANPSADLTNQLSVVHAPFSL
jgi:hypothetical protein